MYFEMVIGTEGEEDFIGYMSHKQEKEHEKFDDLCQVIMTDVFLSFKKTFKGSGKVQFCERIYILFTNDTIHNSVCPSKIPGKKNCFLGVINFCVCELFENVMIEVKDPIVEEKIKNVCDKSIKDQDLVHDVCSFVGYAVNKEIDRCNRQLLDISGYFWCKKK